MQTLRIPKAPLLVGVGVTLAVLFTSATTPFAIEEEKTPETLEETANRLWAEAQKMYEKARTASEKVSEDSYEWAKDDLEKIGDWEYRVVSLSTVESASLEAELNTLGADRWECFWVAGEGKDAKFLFKRPVRSYLKRIPLRSLMGILPQGGGDAGGNE